MNSNQLLDLAAILLERAPLFIERPIETRTNHAPSAGGIELMSCWSSIRSRLNDWSSRLDMAESQVYTAPDDVSSLVNELFVSEPLSQVWTAITTCQQQAQGLNALPAIFRAALTREDTLRQRAVALVLANRILPLETSLQLHRLRKITRRVSRRLIETLSTRYWLARCIEYDIHLSSTPMPEPPFVHWWAAAAQVTTTIRLLAHTVSGGKLPPKSDCSQASQDVATAILRCLPWDALPGSDSPLTTAQLALCQSDQSAANPWPTFGKRLVSRIDRIQRL